MGIKVRLSPLVVVIIAVVVASVVVGSSIYFYILSQENGNYSGPGLPPQGVTYNFTLNVGGYGDWASYGFHSNVTDFYANTTETSLNNLNIQTAVFGIMNQTEYNNLESNTSIQWLASQGPNTDITINYHGTSAGNYYWVIIQEGNGGFTVGGKLTLTEE